MNEVSRFMAKDKTDFSEIITREQGLLDVMRTQVAQQTVVEESKEKQDCTILEHMGLIFEECDDDDIAKIQMALGESVNKFNRAWKVTNIATQKKFDDFVAAENIHNKKLLFHGSRNENWWSILSSGLVLRPTNAIITGKLYGMGIYFAPKAQKSIGYTSLSGSYWAGGRDNMGYMALMEVAYGTPYDVHSFDSRYHNLNYTALQKLKKGANCLHAHAGASMGGSSSLRNDEIVIYKEEQCTIKYLVEIKNH
jgi:poly [ADP-ribose] polymerase